MDKRGKVSNACCKYNIKDTEKPYLKPYHIINRDGIKIAIIGMITPAIPNWLNEKLWEGMSFKR